MKKEKDRRKELEQECKREYEQWGYLYKNGGQDPFWEDGASLNLVRNHILSYKMEMKELDYYPEVYSRELPPEVDNKYMARADEIREHARASYAEYKRDKNYIWLKKHQNDISIADAKKVCLKNILGYVDGLLIFLLNDDLVGMRRHEYPARYEESFKKCRKEMEQIIFEPKPEKIGQIASQCGVSVSSVRNIGAGGIEVAERAKAQQEAKAKVVKFERSAKKIKGRSRLTEDQLKTWAYIHQRYGKNKEEK